MEVRRYDQMSDNDQAELMGRMAEWRGKAESDCQTARELMVKCEDFRNGDQWDAAQKADLEAQGKYVATIPLIRPQVNQLVGYQVSNPKDITCINTHGGMKLLADLKSALLKHAIETNNGPNLFSQWFTRGVVSSRSYIAWMRDFSRDPVNGDIVIQVLPELDCLWDPTHKAYDLNGTPGSGGDAAKFFFWDELVDLDWADKQWPELAEQFGNNSQPAGSKSGLYGRITSALYGVVRRATDAISSRSSEEIPDYESIRYQLSHCWWLDYETAWYWYDLRVGMMDPIICIERKDIRRAKKLTERHPNTYKLVKSMVRVCHHTRYIGDQLIDDIVDEFDLAKYNLTSYPIVGYYPDHSWGHTAGIVQDLIGPQEVVNWLRSYVVNHLKLLPNSGWIIGSDSNGYDEELKRHSGEAAQVLVREKAGGFIEKIEPTAFPGGIDLISDKSKAELREISNIRMESPERDSQEMSGRAILAKQAGSQVGITPHMANFDWSLKIFGNVGTNIIACCNVYSDDEIRTMIEESRLVDDQLLYEARIAVCRALKIEMPEDPGLPNQELWAAQATDVKMSGMQMYVRARQIYEAQIAALDAQAKPMAIQAMIDAVRDPIKSRYTCQVALSPYSLTTRLQLMASMAETNQLLIASQCAPLPERDILEASDLPHKQRLLKERGYA